MIDFPALSPRSRRQTRYAVVQPNQQQQHSPPSSPSVVVLSQPQRPIPIALPLPPLPPPPPASPSSPPTSPPVSVRTRLYNNMQQRTRQPAILFSPPSSPPTSPPVRGVSTDRRDSPPVRRRPAAAARLHHPHGPGPDFPPRHYPLHSPPPPRYSELPPPSPLLGYHHHQHQPSDHQCVLEEDIVVLDQCNGVEKRQPSGEAPLQLISTKELTQPIRTVGIPAIAIPVARQPSRSTRDLQLSTRSYLNLNSASSITDLTALATRQTRSTHRSLATPALPPPQPPRNVPLPIQPSEPIPSRTTTTITTEERAGQSRLQQRVQQGPSMPSEQPPARVSRIHPVEAQQPTVKPPLMSPPPRPPLARGGDRAALSRSSLAAPLLHLDSPTLHHLSARPPRVLRSGRMFERPLPP